VLRELNKMNASTWFLYPLFNLDKMYDEYLYNTYITHTDSSFNGFVGSLFVLFKFSGRISNLFNNSVSYIQLEDKLCQKEEYLCHYDINGGEYVLFCLCISDLYEKDYTYFLEGKYSKIRRNIVDYPTTCVPAYTLINDRWKNERVISTNIKCIMDKSEILKRQYEELKGINIPEGNEIYTGYQDIIMQEKEKFDESKLILKKRF